jgi:ATP-dependent Clp protease ATP-binding subunit ClpB
VVFHALNDEHLQLIVTLQVESLRKRLAEHEIKLLLSPAALMHLAHEGSDVSFGARPLRRAVRQLLENPLAQALLSGQFVAGNTVAVDVRGGELVLGKPQ